MNVHKPCLAQHALFICEQNGDYITNNTSEKQTTVFYDMKGKASEITLKPYEIKWL